MDIRKLVNDILDTAKKQHNIPSDAQLAKTLGVSHVAIWRWRRGELREQTIALLSLLAEQADIHESAKLAA